MTRPLRLTLTGSMLLGCAISAFAAANNGGGIGGPNGHSYDWTFLRGCSTERAMSVARAAGLSNMHVAHTGEDRFVIVGTLAGERASVVLNRETENCRILRIVSL